MKDWKSNLADAGLLYSAIIWGSTFFIIRDSLLHIDPIVLVAYRFSLAAIILGAFLIYLRKNLFADLNAGLILGAILSVVYITQTIGLKYTSATNSGFITGMFVVFVPLFSLIIFRQSTQLHKVLAIGLSMLGLWILTGGLGEMNVGDIWTLGTAVASALHLLYIDKYVKEGINPHVLVFQQFVVISLVSFLLAFIFRAEFTPLISSVTWVVVYLALFPSISAMLVQFVAQRFTTPIRASLLIATEPVFAALFAWTLGGEVFVLYKLIGGLLIVIAIIMSELSLNGSMLRVIGIREHN